MSAERVAAALSLSPSDTPLAFLLAVMQDKLIDTKGVPIEVKFKDRLTAAISAAPFVHPKLSSVEVKGNASEPLTLESDIGRALKELAERARRMDTIEGEILEPATLPSAEKE